jgi:hypothetical protein
MGGKRLMRLRQSHLSELLLTGPPPEPRPTQAAEAGTTWGVAESGRRAGALGLEPTKATVGAADCWREGRREKRTSTRLRRAFLRWSSRAFSRALDWAMRSAET